MPDEKNINKYTAADIAKYHRGLLSPAEKHALEKAALEDPMLADALEGYAAAGVKYEEDIFDLKQRLAQKTGSGKPVFVQAYRSAIFNWWKVAAMIILASGAAWLVYRYAFENDKNNLAVQPSEKETISPATHDQPEGNTKIHAAPLTNTPEPDDKTVKQNLEKRSVLKIKDDNKPSLMADADTAGMAITGKDAVAGMKVSPAFPEKENSSADSYAESNKQQPAVKAESWKAGDGEKAFHSRSESILSKQKPKYVDDMKKSESRRVFYFRGQVTDKSNNPLPFVNITNVKDDVGTYSDAKGYFSLISADSVLNVQVRSLGYANNLAVLRGNVASHPIVLQEDHSMPATVLSQYRPNTERLQQLREANITIEEPEPVDGWENYDTYLVNNRRIPDEKRNRRFNGQVELSFDVAKNGQPVNIKVEKSLCSSCDQEAVRLIQEGPKWKIKGKKSRVKVTVPFDE